MHTSKLPSGMAGRVWDNSAVPERWVRWWVYSQYRTPNVWVGRQMSIKMTRCDNMMLAICLVTDRYVRSCDFLDSL